MNPVSQTTAINNAVKDHGRAFEALVSAVSKERKQVDAVLTAAQRGRLIVLTRPSSHARPRGTPCDLLATGGSKIDNRRGY